MKPMVLGIRKFYNIHKFLYGDKKMKKLIENSENIFYYDGKLGVPIDTEKLIIKGNVEVIESMAFYQHNHIKEVKISDGVKVIDAEAFCDCKKLQTVYIPKSVTEIGDFAFYRCSNLIDVKIAGNPQIGDSAFAETPLEDDFKDIRTITDSELDDAVYDEIKDNPFKSDGSPTSKEKSFSVPKGKIITSTNLSNYKGDIIKFIEDYYKSQINTSNPTRGHILPNGDFLANNKHDWGFSLAHREIEEELIKKMYDNFGYVFIGFDSSGKLGESIFDLIGCIRVNAEDEEYIALPEQKPTSQQMNTLEDWIDFFYWDYNKRWLRIATTDGQQHTYDRDEYDTSDVIQKINRYYNTGTLYESKQKVGEEKVKTVKYCMPFELPKDIKSILKNSGNEKLLSNVYENDYKIKISNVGKNYRGLVESLNRVYTEKCVNYNSYTDTITVFKNYKETTGVSSIGQHKRSSIDLIPEDDSEINKFNVYDDAEDYEYLLELEPDFDTDYVEDEDDGDYLYEDDTETDEGIENSETDELIVNDVSTSNTNTIKPNTNSNDTTIYQFSDDDLEVNIDSQDSTNPMSDFQSRKSNNNSISI